MALKQVHYDWCMLRLVQKRLECNWHTFTIFPFLSLVEGSDYSAADPLEVTFMSGSAMLGSTSCAQITILDDDAFEGSHSFSVEVSAVEIESDGTDPLLTIGTLSSAMINIVDNDSKLFFFADGKGLSSLYTGVCVCVCECGSVCLYVCSSVCHRTIKP